MFIIEYVIIFEEYSISYIIDARSNFCFEIFIKSLKKWMHHENYNYKVKVEYRESWRELLYLSKSTLDKCNR